MKKNTIEMIELKYWKNFYKNRKRMKWNEMFYTYFELINYNRKLTINYLIFIIIN